MKHEDISLPSEARIFKKSKKKMSVRRKHIFLEVIKVLNFRPFLKTNERVREIAVKEFCSPHQEIWFILSWFRNMVYEIACQIQGSASFRYAMAGGKLMLHIKWSFFRHLTLASVLDLQLLHACTRSYEVIISIFLKYIKNPSLKSLDSIWY